MSEYQRYEFMTIDRPLTRAQLDAVNDLSSHIEATSTQAFIEYHHGDFKHNPIGVLREFFDGLLYWANWGIPQLALRFPHGILPADFIAGYDFDEAVTFTQHADYDILDINFNAIVDDGGWGGRWIEADLGSLIPIREELMNGDLRPLYIVWLACQDTVGGDDDDDDDDDDDEDDEDDKDEDEDERMRMRMRG